MNMRGEHSIGDGLDTEMTAMGDMVNARSMSSAPVGAVITVRLQDEVN
jgi:predicted thioesterase